MTCWLTFMRRVSVVPLARYLRIDTHELAGSAATLCPTGDCKGWTHVALDGLSWRCRRCPAGGGAIDFVAFYMRGQRYQRLHPCGKAEVRRVCWVYLEHVQPGPVVERRRARGEHLSAQLGATRSRVPPVSHRVCAELHGVVSMKLRTGVA